MTATWFQLENFYEHSADKCVFYPYLYARGYRFSAEDQVKMDGVLGPFLDRRLKFEFIAAFCFVTFVLMIALTGFLVTASTEQLDAILTTPPGVWLVVAVVFAGVVLLPMVFRLQSRIRRQLDEMGLKANEPARPDFFIVEGPFSPKRLSYAFFAVGGILALVGVIGPAGMVPMGLYALAFVTAFALLALDRTRR